MCTYTLLKRIDPFRDFSRPFAGITFLGLSLLTACAFATTCFAAVEPIVVRVPDKKAWTGERVTFYVDIRVSGSFGGATTFSLPEVPGTIILRVGNADVSSKEIDGDEWFVQSHEFSLFSQTTGKVKLPEFPVRYGTRDGFTGPVTEVEGEVPSVEVEIVRPPGTEGMGFLITTDSLAVSETWDPKPGEAKVGSLFKRTIRQEADQVLGMALPPVPHTAPEGIHVYTSDPTVKDNTQRGAFEGERTETLTYLMEKAGSYTLPAIKFVWWNPNEEKLYSKELPSTTFDVAAATMAAKPTESVERNRWPWVLAFLAISAVLLAIRSAVRWISKIYNTPERVSMRRLLKACHHNDAHAAYDAWLRLPEKPSSPELRSAVRQLEEALYSNRTTGHWYGQELAIAFLNAQLETSTFSQAPPTLPPLNP